VGAFKLLDIEKRTTFAAGVLGDRALAIIREIFVKHVAAAPAKLLH
jgi:hypothetical protein